MTDSNISLEKYIDKVTDDIQNEIDRRIESLSSLLEQRFEAQEAALNKANETLNVRLDSMNEFRLQLQQERSTYVTRKELDLMMQNKEEHSQGSNTNTILLAGVLVSAILSFISLIVSLHPW